MILSVFKHNSNTERIETMITSINTKCFNMSLSIIPIQKGLKPIPAATLDPRLSVFKHNSNTERIETEARIYINDIIRRCL